MVTVAEKPSLGGIWRYKRNKAMNFSKLGSLSRPRENEQMMHLKSSFVTLTV